MSEYQDEIDLRPYLLALFRRWWLIVLIIVLAAGAVYVYSQMQPQVYKATAIILLTRSRSRLALADQFPTENENVDSKSRMEALVSITGSDAVAMETMQTMRDRLATEQMSLSNLKNRVEIKSAGDVIQVTAKADKPELASEIANTWASHATATINAAYGGEQPIALIQAGLDSAREKYQAAQSAYESFVKSNQITLLKSQATEMENLLETLAGERSWQFSYYSHRMQQMDQILADAKALQNRLKNRSDSPAASLGDALAILMAHASVFEVNSEPVLDTTTSELDTTPQNNPQMNNTGPTINVQLEALAELVGSQVDYQEDLGRLIEQVAIQRDEAKTSLEELASDVTQGEGEDLLIETAAQLQQIQERLEIEIAQQKELVGERDLAWNAYKALLQKEAELVNTSQVINEVTLAGQAVEPEQPADRGTLRNVLIAGVMGMLLAMGVIILLEWWRSAKVSQ